MTKRIRVESYKTYYISDKTKLTVKDEGQIYTITKAINQMQSMVIKLTAEEVQAIIMVFHHRNTMKTVEEMAEDLPEEMTDPKAGMPNQKPGDGKQKMNDDEGPEEPTHA